MLVRVQSYRTYKHTIGISLCFVTVGHCLEIEPMQVLTALGEFVTVFMPPEKQELNNMM